MPGFYEGDELSEMYEDFRPTYPVELVTEVLKFLDEQNPGEKRRGFMLDVACGGGQATRLFAPHFEKVLGIDMSASQINMAKKTVPNAEFLLGSDSNFPVESGRVDLVIAGTAAHYFDLDAFLPECDRVLRPGGCVALFGYWPSKLKTLEGKIIEGSTGNSGISGLHAKFEEESGVSAYRINFYVEHHQALYNRLDKTRKKMLRQTELEKKYTVEEYCSFLRTIGEYRFNTKSIGDVDPLVRASTRLKSFLGLTDDNHEKESSFILNFECPIVLFQK